MSLAELANQAWAPGKEGTARVTALVATSFEDAELSRDEWDDFVLDVGGSIFSSYDWCRIWWRHYGRGRSLRVFVFRKENRLVGLAPMFIERIWLGPTTIRIAKRLSADFPTDIFRLPVSVECASSIYNEIVFTLVETEKCDAVWFGFLPSEDPTLTSLRAAASIPGGPAVLARDAAAGVHSCFHIPGSFDAYVAGLGRNARQGYRRKLSLLNKAFEIEHRIVGDPADAPAEFLAFVAFHAKQWEAEGKPGHFGDWPNSAAFNQDLVRQFAELGRLRIMHQYANGNTIAMQYAFTFGANCYWRLPARSAEKDMERFSLGMLSLMQLLEQMSREGVRRVDGGPGHYDYKIQCGGRESEYLSVLVRSARSSSSVRVRLFVALADLIHLAYYRIWRLRVAPRLPFRRRPLWRTWVRFRI